VQFVTLTGLVLVVVVQVHVKLTSVVVPLLASVPVCVLVRMLLLLVASVVVSVLKSVVVAVLPVVVALLVLANSLQTVNIESALCFCRGLFLCTI
jgi:hypothetical protein